MKTHFYITTMLVLCINVIGYSSFAHNGIVHKGITKASAASALSWSPGYGDFVGSVSSDIDYSSLQEQLMNGSDVEDFIYKDEGGFRPYNHFYDPLDETYGKGLSDYPPDLRILVGKNSFVWSSTENCPGLNFYGLLPNVGAVNVRSWPNARDKEWVGFTATHRSDRQAALSDMFRDVGQVMHLLEDTSSPQHVRNEQHITYPPYVWNSRIEAWGAKNAAYLNYTPDILDWYGDGFRKLEDFWDRHLYNGNATVLDAAENGGTSTLGLAEWCNGNFLGERHLYPEYFDMLERDGSKNVKWYPFPSRDRSTDYAQAIANLPSAIQSLNLKNGYQGQAIYINKTGDGLIYTDISRFTYFAAKCSYGMMTINDDNVLLSFHNQLIPKAVEYAAGLLDYYFRGHLKIAASVDSGVYTIAVLNFSQQPFNGGAFYLLKEDSGGNRSLVQEYDLSGTLSPGDFTQLTYSDSLSEATKFILVYKGTIGVNGAQPSDPVDANIAIAAQTFTLDPNGCTDCDCGSNVGCPCGCD